MNQRAGVHVAEQTIVDGSKELSNCLKAKSLNRKDVEIIQSKLEMGVKRKSIE